MPNFSLAPTLELSGQASSADTEQLNLFGAEAGDPKQEKVEQVVKAEAVMGGIGQAATVETTSEQEPVKTMEERSEGVLGEMGTLISTSMNVAVGYDLQAKDARLVAEPLIKAKNIAKGAVDLERYEKGEVTLDALNEEAKEGLARGLTSEQLMQEAEALTQSTIEVKKKQQEALEFDKNLAEARDAYVTALTARKGILPSERARRREELTSLEQGYNEAFVQRISDVMDLNPNHRKAPYPADTMVGLKEDVTFENLTGNHLHILADSLVREQLARTKAIESRSSVGVKKVLGAFKKSRGLRVIVGGAIWGASMAAANKGLLPSPLEGAGEVFEKVLPLVAGYVTSREVMAGVEEGATGFRDRKELKRSLNELSGSSYLGEAALRTIYSNIEYEDVAERQVGETEDETRQAFGAINTQFNELEQSGSRGGKPYSAEDILPIVSELYLERKDQIDQIIESEDPNESFKKLCSEMISKDSEKLTKEVHFDRKKNAILRALSIASSVLIGQFIGVASDLQGASVKPIKWVEKV